MKLNKLNVKELPQSDIIKIDGGNLSPWAIATYIVGEIADGIYQGTKNALEGCDDVQCPTY